MADIFTMGVDIGSTASKCVILKNGLEIFSSSVISAGTGTTGPGRAVSLALENAKLERSDISAVTATGYGRLMFKGADFVVSELSCHAIGAHAAYPIAHTVIDIGGQDAKVIRIGESGKLDSFVMNDKCAAGTGRFLEVMARVLELDVGELAGRDALARNPTSISSTCTVFAESEVISQLAAGTDINDLIAGIHESVAVRTAALARRLGIVGAVAMTGGVARNAGVVRALERQLQFRLFVPETAQINGAHGAAIYAWNKLNKE